MGITPDHIVSGLRGLGFDAVWVFAVELALVNRATRDYVEKWEGTYPLISVACPVIVRLVQVLYPRMVDQLAPVQLPREVAARELKRKYSEELGISRDEIAAIYITPCQAKTISILEPAERVKSNLDGALGISDVYNDILALTHSLDKESSRPPADKLVCNPAMLRWATGKGQVFNLSQHRYMSVTGLANVIQVFEDIYKGKLRNIEYLECHACWGGCVGGNLAVDNVYVTRTKIHRLTKELPEENPAVEAEVEKRYPNEDLMLGGAVRPRATEKDVGNLKERVKRIKTEESILMALPGLDCGLCGAPTCKTFAKDVAACHASQSECVFFSDERLKRLRETYRNCQRLAPEDSC
jgi:hypothetical protein